MLALEMAWRDLLFASWPVDPETVATHLPESLSPDTYGGDAWLSVVPFTNAAVRPCGLPRSLGVDLPELNLRTYVIVDGTPSVYFFSLDAAGVLGVLGARLAHHLPYYYARMEHDPGTHWRTVGGPEWPGGAPGVRDGEGPTRFLSRRRHPGARPVHFRATYEPTGEPIEAEEGSRAAFLTERYRFYTEAQDGSLRYSNIEHERWSLRPAAVEIEANTLFRANGFAAPDGEAVYHYSPGVDIHATPSRRLADD